MKLQSPFEGFSAFCFLLFKKFLNSTKIKIKRSSKSHILANRSTPTNQKMNNKKTQQEERNDDDDPTDEIYFLGLARFFRAFYEERRKVPAYILNGLRRIITEAVAYRIIAPSVLSAVSRNGIFQSKFLMRNHSFA